MLPEPLHNLTKTRAAVLCLSPPFLLPPFKHLPQANGHVWWLCWLLYTTIRYVNTLPKPLYHLIRIRPTVLYLCFPSPYPLFKHFLQVDVYISQFLGCDRPLLGKSVLLSGYFENLARTWPSVLYLKRNIWLCLNLVTLSIKIYVPFYSSVMQQ